MVFRPGVFINSISVWLLSMPLTTRIVLTFVAICFPLSTSIACLSPSLIINSFQGLSVTRPFIQLTPAVYRILTYAMSHANLFHLAFNLISFLSVARRMERDMGSTRFGCTIVLLSNTVAFLYITVAIIGRMVFRDWDVFESCVVGFSGVLFALLVIFVYQFAVTEAIMLAGFIPVPSTAYPWILLVIFQFLPHVSFLCHICGIITGFAFVHGFMQPLQFSTSTIHSLERWVIIRNLIRYNGFVACTENRLPVVAPRAPAAPTVPVPSSEPVPSLATLTQSSESI